MRIYQFGLAVVGTLVMIGANSAIGHAPTSTTGGGIDVPSTSGGSTGSGTGLTAEYFDNADWTQHKVTENEPVAEAGPPTGIILPLSNANTTGNGYSVIWSGKVKAEATGTHTFNIAYSSNGTGPINGWITVVGNTGVAGTASILQRPITSSSPVSTILTVGTQYNIILKLQSWNTGNQQTLTPSWSCHGTDANGDPITITGNVPTADLYPAIGAPLAPNNNYVVTTGDQRNTIYYTVPANAAFGFYVYSSLSPGAENYNLPISPAVDPPGGGQTGTMSFADTGEPDGVNRYYAVKLTYLNSVTGTLTMSSPSVEDYDAPNATGIPWDSGSVAGVLNSIRAQFAADPDNPNLGTLYVAGPDGSIYADGNTSVKPPDATYDAAAGTFDLTGGGTITAPFDGDPLNTTPDPVDTPAELPFQGKIGQYGGIYRRVRTDFLALGCKGTFGLPIPSSSTQMDGRDGLFIYLGHTGVNPPSEVDAGLMWSNAHAGWAPFISKQIDDPALPADWFKGGTSVALTYYTRRYKTIDNVRRLVSLVNLSGTDIHGNPLNMSVATAGLVTPGQVVRAKRLHSIGQSKLTVFQPLYATDRVSHILGVAWHNGMIRLSNGSWFPWLDSDVDGTAITTENGAYPWPSGKIAFNPSPFFTDETGISLDVQHS